jgi:hypothetical protein
MDLGAIVCNPVHINIALIFSKQILGTECQGPSIYNNCRIQKGHGTNFDK